MSHHNLDAITVHQARQPFDVPGLDDFEWAQESDTASFFFSVGAGVRGRDLLVRMLPTTLCVRCHGRILLDGPLGGTIAPEESEWELVDGALHLTLRKAQQCEWRIPIRQTTATTTPGTAPAATGASAPSRPASSATAPPPQPRRLPALDRSAGGSSVLRDAYRAWDRFDEAGALAAVENEGKSEDSIGVTLRAGGGTAALQCTDYVKDTEEVELDEELGRKRSSLQATLNARLAQAAELKAQGNRLLSDGQPRAALERYLEGEGALCALEHARVLCSAHMVGVGQVIKGWDQGICTMKKGEVCTLTCRHDYAYGESGHPPKIPAGATLKFEVELFGWKEERKQKWELDEAGKQATAAELKEKGTAALKAGSNDEAYELYVDAASYVEGESAEPARALLLSCQLNAAAAALKLKEWALAEAAAGKALAVEPASVKALYRRGTARMHGGDFAAAKADLRAAATADPKDRAVRDAFAECGRREAEAKKAEKAVAARMFS